MGLFTKEPTGPVEKVECDSCKKKFAEDDLDGDGLCETCENKTRCGDCENYFDEVNDDDRCTKCAETASAKVGEEELDCADCEKTFKRKQLIEDEDGDGYCEKCWKTYKDNEAACISIDLTGVKNTFRWTNTKINQDKIYSELVNAMQTGKEFADISFPDGDKGIIRTSTVSSIYYHVTGEQYDDDTDYSEDEE